MPSQVTEASFAHDVLERPRTVLVEFTATWCPPCHAMKPVLEQLARAHPDVEVVVVDADENASLAARYGVRSLPTFLAFRGGAPTGQIVGACALRVLTKLVE